MRVMEGLISLRLLTLSWKRWWPRCLLLRGKLLAELAEVCGLLRSLELTWP